jgi:tripartite-type tricarboxylate transporter receptor subunit TctC
MVATQGHTPPAIVARLNAEIRAVMEEPDVKTSLVREGAIPQVTPVPEALKAFVASEIARWGNIVQEAGIAGSE